METKTGGYIFLICSVAFFIYYTLWVIVLPFVDSGNKMYSFFPSWEIAFGVPVVCIIIGASIVFVFISLVMITSDVKEN
ncbi:dolichyl-phosphate mannosyltransferase polypeptide 2 [Piromyces finnis]|uniref:Dolichol phosphate-mannose biosynthesis regulatory protein n=1 Tax=Piromyces finnis TaxID=1754191 RepID=A0A1Y1VJX2_9FUNG|nr:dolichyl-phosphate mannosyltransferase polypeptide 2 [Piromyces finnis]|eukprot:ORX57352.1 dolichyl-phosphate mannosyltransferase polypeptide 2 [Piromyces finnis]